MNAPTEPAANFPHHAPGTDYKLWYRETYLKSEHWKELRSLAFEIYGKKCAVCGTKKKLDVHHLNYRRIWDVTVADLQVLCRKHHKEEHLEEVKAVAGIPTTEKPHTEKWHPDLPQGVIDMLDKFMRSTVSAGGAKAKRNWAINQTIQHTQRLGPEVRLILKSLKSGKKGKEAQKEIRKSKIKPPPPKLDGHPMFKYVKLLHGAKVRPSFRFGK